MKRVHFLLTNDDGITSPGLLALAESLAQVGQVTVIAPDHNWSIAGHVKTLHKPLRADPVTLANGMSALSTTGAPSDAVSLGLLGLAEAVDVVVAGINAGANMAYDITYSGTVMAAMEGAIGGVPSLAVSLNTRDMSSDFHVAADFAARLARLMAEHAPAGMLLNVNVPLLPADEIRGVRVTRLGRRIYHDELVQRVDPSGRPYYWIGGKPPTGHMEPGTDVAAIAEGYISVTPVQLDCTAYEEFELLKQWGIESDTFE
jgi:5'-nucleotidase